VFRLRPRSSSAASRCRTRSLLGAPDDRTIDLRYTTNLSPDPDLTSWNLLERFPVGTGVTREPTRFQLKLYVGVLAGAGSARFAHFQQCP
jgi:hypothetical protein